MVISRMMNENKMTFIKFEVAVLEIRQLGELYFLTFSNFDTSLTVLLFVDTDELSVATKTVFSFTVYIVFHIFPTLADIGNSALPTNARQTTCAWQ